MSICNFVYGNLSVDYCGRISSFSNLPSEVQVKFNDYKITVQKCEGTESEKLNWFRRINIACEALTDQEILNSVYTGPWLSDAKRHFSKTGCAAYTIGKDFLDGVAIRQDYLEEVLRWAADSEGLTIEGYMAKHRVDADASELWNYFRAVIDWVTNIFGNVLISDSKKVQWGILYNRYKDSFTNIDKQYIKSRVDELRDNDEVTRKSGVYEYILSGESEEKCLNIRKFPEKIARKRYEQQNHMCARCGMYFPFEQMEADHIVPWSEGGETTIANCEMLCRKCNRAKSNKQNT